MEGEGPRLLLDGVRRDLDRLGHSAVQLATTSERQSFVGGVADEGVAEAHTAVRIRVHETSQAFPELRVERHLVVKSRLEEVRVEGRAQYRRVSEHHPVRRSEPVDVRRDDGLDRVRECVGRPGLAHHVEQLEEEEDVAGRPLGDQVDGVRRQQFHRVSNISGLWAELRAVDHA